MFTIYFCFVLMRICLTEIENKIYFSIFSRGVGLFVGFELVKDREQKTPATETAAWLVKRCERKMLLIQFWL